MTEIIGWVGTILIVIAYFLISWKKVESTNKYYQLINLVGAIAVGVNVFTNKAWPAFALQVVWGLIAISSLVKSKVER